MLMTFIKRLCNLNLLIPLFLADSAIAGTSDFCTGFINFTHASIENKNQSNQMVYCRDLQIFDEAYSNMANLLPEGILKPSLRATNELLPDLESFATLGMAFSIGIDKSQTKELDLHRKLFSHEVGHQIFDYYLFKELPNLVKFGNLRKKSLDFFNKNYVSIMAGCVKEKEPLEVDDPCFRKALKLQNDALSLKYPKGSPIDQLEAKSDKFVTFFKYTVAYDELFADVVSAAHYNDANVVAHVVGELRDGPSVACRSFSERLSPEFSSKDPHCELSVLRKKMWDQWILPRVNSKKPKKAILEELAKILVSEALWRYQSDAINSQIAIFHLANQLGLH